MVSAQVIRKLICASGTFNPTAHPMGLDSHRGDINWEWRLTCVSVSVPRNCSNDVCWESSSGFVGVRHLWRSLLYLVILAGRGPSSNLDTYFPIGSFEFIGSCTKLW